MMMMDSSGVEKKIAKFPTCSKAHKSSLICVLYTKALQSTFIVGIVSKETGAASVGKG